MQSQFKVCQICKTPNFQFEHHIFNTFSFNYHHVHPKLEKKRGNLHCIENNKESKEQVIWLVERSK